MISPHLQRYAVDVDVNVIFLDCKRVVLCMWMAQR